MKIHLINLDKDVERLAYVSSRLAALGLTFARTAAVDGRLLPASARKPFLATPRTDGNVWLPGEIGCLLSHRAVWQLIAAGDAPSAVVLEDDIHVADCLPEYLQRTDWLPAGFDIVRLESTTNRIRMSRAASPVPDQRGLRQVRSTTWCTGGYIISAECARRLLTVEPRHYLPVDRFLFSHEYSATARQLIVYQVTPAVVTQDKHVDAHRAVGLSSNIEYELGPESQVLRWVKRFSPGWFVRTALGYVRVPFRA